MVQSNTVMLGWNRAVTGREQLAAELFASTTSWLEKQRTAKRIESWEPVLLGSHGGDLNGFFLIKGTHAQLEGMLGNEEWRDLVFRADHCLLGLGILSAYTGMQVVGELMQQWSKTIAPTR